MLCLARIQAPNQLFVLSSTLSQLHDSLRLVGLQVIHLCADPNPTPIHYLMSTDSQNHAMRPTDLERGGSLWQLPGVW